MDALAPEADEGRGKLRKATGNCKQVSIRGDPNGETQSPSWVTIPQGRGTRGTETSKYPEEEKSNEMPTVAASEAGRAQTGQFRLTGVEDRHNQWKLSRTTWKGRRNSVKAT